MSLNLPLQNLLQNTQHMCSFCVLGRPCQISSAVLIRPIRAFCPWNLAWIWHLSLIWTNHNKSLSFSCFISWETAYFGIFVKKLALFLEITSARRGTSLRTALCVWALVIAWLLGNSPLLSVTLEHFAYEKQRERTLYVTRARSSQCESSSRHVICPPSNFTLFTENTSWNPTFVAYSSL